MGPPPTSIALDRLARRHDAWLVVDEAHALGTAGPGGRGLAAELGVEGDHVVRVVTFSKALGAAGAAICGAETVHRLLLQRGRALIFSTAPPHPTIAAASAALRVSMAEPELVLRLHERSRLLRLRLGELAMPGAHPPPPSSPSWSVTRSARWSWTGRSGSAATWSRGCVRRPWSRARAGCGWWPAPPTRSPEIEGVASALTELLSP